MAKVSFTQYSTWSSCPQQYKLNYIDKLGESSSNINSIFGTAVHETLQHYLTVFYNTSKKAADTLDLDKYLLERMRENFIKEKQRFTEGSPCTQLELEEYYGDGRRIIEWLKKNTSKFFGNTGWKLVGIEIPLSTEIKPGVNFIGYIDIVLKNVSSDTILIIDLKTSTRGWNQYQKNDKIKNAQILIYKKWYSDLFDVPLNKIDVEFHIMRRKLPEESSFPVPYVSKHVPANGKPSVMKAYNEFMEFINTVFSDTGEYNNIDFPKVPGKNKKNCQWCEFMKRNICDGIE
jgi:PD-(D/E)XK nuclease superfamily